MAVQNTEEWRELFEEYKSKPELWQINCDKYKNKHLRSKAWKDLFPYYLKIDENGTIDILKRKMTNIRTCYRRELKKVIFSERSGGGADDVYLPALWYFDLFEFLRDLEVPAASITTMNNLAEDEENSISNLSTLGNRKRPRQSNQRGEFLRKAVEYLDNEATSSHRGNKKDEADVYAEGWAISFRKLSEDQKLIAKRIIEEALLLGQLTKLSLASQITNTNRFDLLEQTRSTRLINWLNDVYTA